MKKRFLSIWLIALSILTLTLSIAQMSANMFAASPPQKTLTEYVPAAVISGEAHLIGPHSRTDHLSLAIGLPLRNQQALTQFLHDVSNRSSVHYRHYLTQAQANQAFNPTPQQERQVISWLQSHGLTVTHTHPNHLLIDVAGTVEQVEHLFHITINDYTMQLEGRQITFYAPANESAVDGSVGSIVESILGLDDYPWFHIDAPLTPAHPANNGKTDGSPPYYPQDFANAYDVNPVWNAGDIGIGQRVGVVLWGSPPSDNALSQFTTQTGANVATRANGRLRVIPVDGGSASPVSANASIEAGMDVEYTSSMAPGATIDYYESPDTMQGSPTSKGLDDALNMAGTDTYDNVEISDSWYWSDSRYWGSCEAANISDPFTLQTEQIFQSNTATGHDYFFSSGDTGSACVPNHQKPCSYKDPYPQYPASSAYVTSVGGTTFQGNINGGYPGEVAWNYTSSTCKNGKGNPPSGSGGGFSKLFPQPAWQVGFSKNKYRGYPDIAADADPNTGALVCFDGPGNPTCGGVGGTSLATPLWAGMMADVNEYVESQGGPPLGFVNALLYEIAKLGPYTSYHDITKGTNGKYSAGPSWDAVTGLGSPDLYNLAQDAAIMDANPATSLNGIAAVSATDVWAVGTSHGTTLIDQWNGSTWNVVPSPSLGMNSILYSVAAVSATDVWAVGSHLDSNGENTLIAQWNGSSWNVVPSPTPGQSGYLSGVAAVSATDIWAVGTYQDSNGQYTLIEHWNGSSWNVVPSPSSGQNDYLSSVAAVSSTNVWAVGYYYSTGSRTLLEHWNGSSWNVVSNPDPWDGLSSLAAVSATDVWAVGGLSTGGTLTEQWNGSSWNIVPSPTPGLGGSFSSVAAVSATDVWAVGSYGDSNGYYTLIEHRNGSAWSVLPSPNPGSGRTDVLKSVAAVSATDAWAVGSYDDSNKALTEQLNGGTWNVVPNPN